MVRLNRIARMLLIVGALAAALFVRYRKWLLEPSGNPRDFLQRGRQPSTRKVVVCAGDSLTHGVVSANYVAMLRERFARNDYEFVNAGINGNVAYNVLQRLDDIIACQPDAVTLLIGTNDVNATQSPQFAESYMKTQNAPVTATLDAYRQNVTAIVERLRAETSAQIALVSLPMLGEDLSSVLNGRIAAYSEALKTIAAERGVTYLPLHEKLVRMLPPDHNPPPYEGDLMLVLKATLKHYFQRKSWDEIGAEHGLRVLTDHIHLNDTAAKVVADLIGEFLTQQDEIVLDRTP